MKTKYIVASSIVLISGICIFTALAQTRPAVAPPPAKQGQTPFLTPEEKRALRKNLVVKEMNTDAKGKRQWIDHYTVWDENGYKLEEIEYAVYGQRERVTFEYDANGVCIRENVYNDKNKLDRIRKYDYLPNGRKKTQYNYLPNGKLYSTKVYEYSYQ